MARSNNLGDGVVSPAETLTQLLHTGTSDVGAGGVVVRQGNATQSGLILYDYGIGIRNSVGFKTKVVSAATADRLLTMPDADLDLADVVRQLKLKQQCVALDAAVTNSTVTPVVLPMVDDQGNEIKLAANAYYEVRGWLMCQSAATTTGVRLRLTGPVTGVDTVYLTWEQPTGSFTSTNVTALGSTGDYLPTSAPSATAAFPQTVRGSIKTGATVSNEALQMWVYSEIAASSVTILPTSYLIVKRVR